VRVRMEKVCYGFDGKKAWMELRIPLSVELKGGKCRALSFISDMRCIFSLLEHVYVASTMRRCI